MLRCAPYTVHDSRNLLSCSSPLVKYHTLSVIVTITVGNINAKLKRT